MTHYATCNGCILQNQGCPKRERVRETIKGLGVTSLKFSCPARSPLFMTGQRVSFPWRHYDDESRDIYGEVSFESLTFHGTIIQEVRGGNRYVVLVDGGPCIASDGEIYESSDVFRNEDLFIKVKRTDLTAIDGALVDICVNCGGAGVTSRCLKSEWLTPSGEAPCMRGDAE